MPNLNPLIVGLVEVGAGLLVPYASVPLILGKFVETIISDQKEIQQEISLIHGRINRLEQRVATVERRTDALERRLNQQVLQPFRTAHTFLERAKNESKKKERRRFIEQAQHYFIEASGVDVSRIHPNYIFSGDSGINRVIPIRARFYVGVCYALLEKNKKALSAYLDARKLVVSFIRSQDIVYNKWQTVKKSELDWLAELMAAIARKGTELTNEENSEGLLEILWDMGEILGSWPMNQQKPLKFIKNSKLREIRASRNKEQLRKSYAKKMVHLDNYPNSLDNLINPLVNDKETMLHRKHSPVSLISRETYIEAQRVNDEETMLHRKHSPVLRISRETYKEAQFESSNRSRPLAIYGPMFKDAKSLKLDYRESFDAWDLAIGLTNMLASIM